MENISQIDKNFSVVTSINEKDITFYNVKKEPFKIYGLYNNKAEGKFMRIPEDVAKEVSENVATLNYHTAGGRVRFKTNSKYIAINVSMSNITFFSHMTLTGTSGFDIYSDDFGKVKYHGTFIPPIYMKNGFESVLYFKDIKERDIIINFPLYNGVDELYIGLQNSAQLKKGKEYNYIKPVLYYGSSITQGGCASRPGNSYQAIISRNIDCDYINLGFSGSAKAEDAIADYISKTEMSVFVFDYDHNAPDINYLKSTHENFFKKIRATNSDLPIILISKPDFDNNEKENIIRRDIIYKTYLNALNSGDSNVYYIDGQRLFKDEGRDCCTVDGCHPNDLGFYRMAETIGYYMKDIIKK